MTDGGDEVVVHRVGIGPLLGAGAKNNIGIALLQGGDGAFVYEEGGEIPVDHGAVGVGDPRGG